MTEIGSDDVTALRRHPGAKSEICGIIHVLACESLSVIVSSSELPEVFAIADRCVVFSQGELVGSLDRSEMTEQRTLRLAFTNHKENRS